MRAKPNAELLIIAIARHVADTILKTRLKDLAHADEPKQYADSAKAVKVLAEVLPKSIDAVNADPSKIPAVLPRGWKEEGDGDIGLRKSMEDRHVLIQYLNELMNVSVRGPLASGHEAMSFYAILDGHGGVKCADYVASQLFAHVVNKLKATGTGDLVALLKKAFLDTNDRFYQYQLRKRIPDTCGATAVATFIYGKDVYVCWAGDSEAALFSRDGSERHLCVVHKAGLDSERVRISELGGIVSEIGGVFRVNGSLAVTRAFGDSKHKKYVTAEPDVIQFRLDGTQDYLVLACDGLWDVMRDSDVSAFIRTYRAEHGGSTVGSAKALCKEAIARGSKDNVSTLVITFDDPNPKPFVVEAATTAPAEPAAAPEEPPAPVAEEPAAPPAEEPVAVAAAEAS